MAKLIYIVITSPISPILVGGGKQSQPNHVLLRLDLLAERRFGNGVVHLHYRPKRVS
jgi:hypothetical protein